MPILLNRDVSFCKRENRENKVKSFILSLSFSIDGSPITKCFVLLTSTTTLFSTLLVFNPTNATVKVCTKKIIIFTYADLQTLWHVLRSCSFPSVGTWVMGVVLMYWTRPLERHLGSVKFVVRIKIYISTLTHSLSLSPQRVTFTSYLLSLSLYVLSLSSLHLILNDNITSTLLLHHINFM